MALRYAYTSSPETVKSLTIIIGPKLDVFLNLIQDADLEVKRQTCLTVGILIKANESMVRRDTLEKVVLPALYNGTQPKPELITEIDYGAFKKQVDGGLPLRKAAFATLETIVETCPHRVNMSECIRYLLQGLVDDYDQQIATYHFFRRTIAAYHASSLLEVIDTLPQLVIKSIQDHLKAVKVAPGADMSVDPLKAGEALRSFVLAINTFNSIPGVELNKKYTHFVQQVFATPYLKTLMAEIEASKAT